VFVSAIGSSFVEQILPPKSVHIAWSSMTLHWISSCPPASSSIFPQDCPEISEEVSKIAAQEWESFVKARSCELKPGGKLIAIFGGKDENGNIGLHDGKILLNKLVKDLVVSGAITQEEFNNMKIPIYYRSKQEVVPILEKYGFHSFQCLYYIPNIDWWTPFIQNKDPAVAVCSIHINHCNFVANLV